MLDLSYEDKGFNEARFTQIPTPKTEAWVIMYFDTMAEKRVWPNSYRSEDDAIRARDAMISEGVHFYNIVRTELR